ncbi:MAG TPA: enoyl-CoA hydratase/isomerase family protein [Streptosporangiaceae bacterium]
MSPDSAPPAGALAGDVAVEVSPGYVATVELRRPPDNFFDVAMIRALADAYQALDDDPACRVIVLCAAGKHFCAGANLGGEDSAPNENRAPNGAQGAGGIAAGAAASSHPAEPAAPSGRPASPLGVVSELYAEAVRLFEARTPVIAVIQGAAIGGGLGLACSADFRIAAPEARFAANFARLGFHQGFGLTVTLPAIIGGQRSLELLYTGRRVRGEEAARIGLADRLVPADRLRPAAYEMAAEIAASAPLAVRSIRETMRGHLAAEVRAATEREGAEQNRLRQTADFREGIAATAQRRPARFEGR